MDAFRTVKSALAAREFLSRILGPPPRRGWAWLCPFHPDKTPSLSGDPHGGGIRCWGCQWAGDIFRFLEAVTGCTRGEALAKAAEVAGILLPDAPPPVKAEPPESSDEGAKSD